MQIHSPAFAYGEVIPVRYTCDGKNVNPPLSITGVPMGTDSLLLVMEDPDSPMMTWIHWRVWNIAPDTSAIREDSVPVGAIQGTNTFGYVGYGGPCPQQGEHRYIFRLYALDTKLHLDTKASLRDMENAMLGHVIEKAALMGYYRRQNKG